MHGVAKEAVWVDRMAIKVFTKVMPLFEHYMCTNFGISEESCGGINDPLGDLG